MGVASFDVDGYFGSLLIGAYTNLCLLGLEIVLFFQYRLSKETRQCDGRFLQSMVAFLFLNDVLCSTIECAEVYRNLITLNGRLPGLRTFSNWRTLIFFLSTGLSVITVQLWMTYRYFRMSKRRVVCTILAVYSFLPFVTNLLTGITHFTRSQDPDIRKIMRKYVIISFTSVMIIDFALAVLLIWELWRVKPVFRTTKFLVRKISSHAIQSGCISLLLALMTGIAYIVEADNKVSGAVSYNHGRVYTCSMLFALNYRSMLRQGIGGHMVDCNMTALQTTRDASSLHMEECKPFSSTDPKSITLEPSSNLLSLEPSIKVLP
ncbi:hypothetical protein HGRIS_000165 [Hohenbuehelia grisea]|uniref:DUF6534 domain-containing protein n=1 Tax=Hohenbuehelia grisea TaxID=104357 RepID=A0ABR3JRF3_9AGAR